MRSDGSWLSYFASPLAPTSVIQRIHARKSATRVSALLTTIQRTFDWDATTPPIRESLIGDAAMAHSNQTIHDVLDALQIRFGAFPVFEDVESSVLDAEKANDAQLDQILSMAREAAALADNSIEADISPTRRKRLPMMNDNDNPDQIADDLVGRHGIDGAFDAVREGVAAAQALGDNYRLSVWREVRQVLGGRSEGPENQRSPVG